MSVEAFMIKLKESQRYGLMRRILSTERDEKSPISMALNELRPELKAACTYEKRMVDGYLPFNKWVSDVMMLPFGKSDETTSIGCLRVFLEVQEDIGLVKKLNDGTLVAVDKYKRRKLDNWGDGLTVKLFCSMRAKIRKLLTHVGNEELVAVLTEVLDQVRIYPGPLHIAMHMTELIFTAFYPGLLQASQACVQWKRIRKDPIPRFQLSKRLIELVHGQLARYFIKDWRQITEEKGWIEVKEENGMTERYRLHRDAAIELGELALFTELPREKQLQAMSDDFGAYLDSLKESEDEIVKYFSNFFELSSDLLQYYESMRGHNSVALLVIFIKWLPRWKAFGKTNYADLVLLLVEQLAKLSPMEMEELFYNFLLRLNEGRRAVAFDEMCEILNDWLKKFCPSDEIEGYIKKCRCVLPARACALLVQGGQAELKSSTQPRANDENRAIYQLLMKIEPTKSAGRKVDDDFIWKHVPACRMVSTNVDDKPASGGAERRYDERITSLFNAVAEQAPVEASDSTEEAWDIEDMILTEAHEAGDIVEDNDDQTDAAEQLEDAIDDLKNMKRYKTNRKAAKDLEELGRKELGDVKAKRAELKKNQEKRDRLTDEIVAYFRSNNSAEEICDNMKKLVESEKEEEVDDDNGDE